MTMPFILDSLSIMLISMLITALISSAGESSVANVWKLDILGSALAQIAARALGSGCALVFLLHPGKLPIHITRKNLFVCRKDVASSILRVSVPFGTVPAVHVGRAHRLWLCAVLPAGAGH